MNKHFIANKYLPIALALAAFTAAGTATVVPSSVARPDPFGVNRWFNR
jgi:hypothetical protein